MPLVEQSDSGNRCSFRLRRIGTAATFPGISDTFKINKEITLVGRNPSSSDIFLDSNKNKVMISRLHARIITEKDDNGKHSFKISDTSLNGTYVNDIKIADSCDIHPGDIITFGHLRGAVLSPGMFAEQQDSEFRFAFERYPATPPEKSKKMSSEESSCSPEFGRQTPSHKSLKPGPKTPLFSAFNLPQLSSFVTPGTPGQVTACTSINKSTRLPDSVHAKHSWQQDFVGDSCNSEHSDDDLLAYAATAVGAMEDSDEDLFSVQLPESPESFNEAYSPSNRSEHLLGISSIAEPTLQVNESKCKRFKAAQRRQTSHVKIANRRHSKSKETTKKRKMSRKSSKSKDSVTNQEEDDSMYNTCASVDCVHPHNKQKIVDWVQCDDCDAWYHVKCMGLTLKSVRPKSALFHCGCMYM
ncbi:transcription factor 19-like [Montipora capricornis]|uniref:transcription factor 19-like n=1 Tax=Montipora capricornis TaxID=246305 RepID=UPI0035F12038